MITFESRSLSSTHGLRPAPLVHTTEDKQIHIIITNWGSNELNEKIIEAILQSTNSPNLDLDVTQQRNVSTQAQNSPHLALAKGISDANAAILKAENLWKWKTVAEVLVLQFKNNIMYWAQAGQPQVFIRSSRGVEPVCYTPDSSANFQQPAPLPLNGIGLEESATINSGSLVFTSAEELLLLSSVYAPAGLYLSMSFDLAQTLDLISQNIPNTPAWVGLLKK